MATLPEPYYDRDGITIYCGDNMDILPHMPTLVFTPGLANLGMWYRIATPFWVGAWVKMNSCSRSAFTGFSCWEPVLFYGKQKHRLIHDVWNGLTSNSRNTDTGDHPCPKHLPFITRLVEQFTDPGDLILDLFMGVGTTLVAAKSLGRRAIGIEINPKYCDVAVERLQKQTLPLPSQPSANTQVIAPLF